MTKIEYFPSFYKSIKKLNKKNKNLLKDLKLLIKTLEKNPTIGISLGNDIYKIRIANSSKNVGKRGGFRVITYYMDENNIVYLAQIYEKSDIDNIPIQELKNLIEKEMKEL